MVDRRWVGIFPAMCRRYGNPPRRNTRRLSLDTNARQSTGNRSSDDQQAILTQLDQTLESAGIYLASEIRDGALDSLRRGDRAGGPPGRARCRPCPGRFPRAHHRGRDRGYGRGGRIKHPGCGRRRVVAYDQDAMRDAMYLRGGWLDRGRSRLQGDAGTTDSQLSAEEGVPYFPPTDPVVRTQDALGR